ncbi:hypothetical protein VS_II0357 [Vibrio atlanticus]|uniref:Uncharacterized protein n=1 Tax=Vibrio atlanticus (strain LGP32) TaxID=575788 RepID=B7VQX3_VIBA3|nr:hypothetical protein VS_II0357 [Vibrio atlanticus]
MFISNNCTGMILSIKSKLESESLIQGNNGLLLLKNKIHCFRYVLDGEILNGTANLIEYSG